MNDTKQTREQLQQEIHKLRTELSHYQYAEREYRKIVEALQESEDRYHDLFEHAHDLIQAVSADGHFIYTNRAWRETLGFTEAEAAKLTLKDVLAPESQEQCLKIFTHALDGHHMDRVDITFLTKDGRRLQLEGNINCRFVNGQPVSTRGILRDMTERKQAEEAVREAAWKYQSLFESLQDLFFRTDNAGNIILVSPSIVQLLGYTQEEACQLNMERDLFVNPVQWKELVRAIEENRSLEEMEVLLKRWDGSVVWGSVNSQWYTDCQGKILGIEGMIRDIAKRKQAEESLKLNQERLEALVALHAMHESSIEEIAEFTLERAVHLTQSTLGLINYVSEEDGRLNPSLWSKGVLKSSPAKATYFSTRNAALWTDVLKKQTPLILNDYHATYQAGARTFNELPDIERALIVPVFDEEHLVLLSAVANKHGLYDETDRDELTLLMSGMWNHIKGQLAAEELRQAKERAETANVQLRELNVSKDTFFSIIAHDLRGPLSSLHELTQHIEESLDTYNTDELKELIVLQKNSAEALYKLLENLLTWSRVQRGALTYQPQPINLRWFINRNVELLTLHARKKSITLVSNVHEEIMVYADFNMIDAVIRNLLSNAIKFTEPGGKVEITASHDDDFVSVAVADTGIGIEEEHIADLFRIDVRHKRVGTAQEEGTGLGLILCKEFIEKHGGAIWVESEVRKGATFTFTLPNVSPEAMEALWRSEAC